MFSRCLFLSLLGLAGCSTLPVATISDRETSTTDLPWNSVEDDLATLMNTYQAPSLSVAVIRDGDLVFSRSFGYSNIDQKQAANEKSQYAIGSIVKPFTSALIGLLESQGLISLSDHPSKYLEELVFSDSDLNENLTIANLLSHTSGLSDISGSLAFFPEPDQRDLLPRLAHFSASCRVGDCWQYNNLNYVLLDAIAETVTGKNKSELLLERQLRPAGMANSVSATDAYKSSAHAAVGYALIDDVHVRTATEYLFGEQVYATAGDLALWLDEWMTSNEDTDWARYAKRAFSMQAISNGSPPTADDPSVYLFGYGYGWRIKSVEGHYVVEHGGNENGFSAQVLFVPAERVGVVALTNQQGSLLPYMANDIMLRSALSLPERDPSNYPVLVTSATALLDPDDRDPTFNPENPPLLAIDEIVGHYEAVGYGRVHVDDTGDSLLLTTPAATFILRHRFDDTFGLASSEPVPAGVNLDFFEITFSKDSLSANFAREPVVFLRSRDTNRSQ